MDHDTWVWILRMGGPGGRTHAQLHMGSERCCTIHRIFSAMAGRPVANACRRCDERGTYTARTFSSRPFTSSAMGISTPFACAASHTSLASLRPLQAVKPAGGSGFETSTSHSRFRGALGTCSADGSPTSRRADEVDTQIDLSGMTVLHARAYTRHQPPAANPCVILPTDRCVFLLRDHPAISLQDRQCGEQAGGANQQVVRSLTIDACTLAAATSNVTMYRVNALRSTRDKVRHEVTTQGMPLSALLGALTQI